MRKLLLLLMLLLGGTAMGQVWQPIDPSGLVYSEPYSGTQIISTPTSFSITTTPTYTSVTEAYAFTFIVYDIYGHMVERIDRYTSDIPEDVCGDINRHISSTEGTFHLIIYGQSPWHATMSYTIEDYTYTTYLEIIEILQSILR